MSEGGNTQETEQSAEQERSVRIRPHRCCRAPSSALLSPAALTEAGLSGGHDGGERNACRRRGLNNSSKARGDRAMTFSNSEKAALRTPYLDELRVYYKFQKCTFTEPDDLAS